MSLWLLLSPLVELKYLIGDKIRRVTAVSVTHSSHAGVYLVKTIISCKVHYIIYVNVIILID